MLNEGVRLWAGMIGVAAAVLVAVVLGILLFLNLASTPVHPEPKDVPTVTGVSPPPAWKAAVERARQAAREGLLDGNLPALSVAVGVNRDLVWAEGFGWADLEARRPVTPDLRFRIGHVSKALTSAAVGLLLEEDRMQLDEEIQTYVPGFPRKQWPVTLRQLMGHVAGIRHYESEADHMPSAHCQRASEGLPLFSDDPLLFEPNTASRYSTYGWILVSAAVEAVSSEPFGAFMRRRVFEPLKMSETTFDASRNSEPDRVTFYYPRFSGDPTTGPEPAREADYSCFSGAGAILSTPSDLVRFGLALGSGGLLRRATVARLQAPQLLASGEATQYGLGWMLNTVSLGGEETREAGHASLTLLGGSTSFLTFPDRGLVVAVTSNISRANTRAIALRVAEAFAAR